MSSGSASTTGPGRPGGGDAVGSRDIFGDAPRVLDPRRPFGDGREESGEVDFLEALAVAVAARDVAENRIIGVESWKRDMDFRR